ncbi:MAG: 3'-5' exonuclease [Nostoc sp. ChiSLP01]|nr:3'-5' exonuclease [Nostoc sp. CmiSLP01]MDZ8287365.1 3'-5' exonuclease [Nostoc sp. ChiSLP01]
MRDKHLAINWARNILTENNWCILDTETTDLKQAEIIQIGVLALGMQWETLVKPTIPISQEAIEIHGITNDAVEDAPTFDQVFLQLMRRIGGRDLIIYNADFDLRAIKNSLRVHGIQLAFPTSDRRQCRIFTNGGSIHCAMLWYSQWVGEWNSYHGDYKWQPLSGGNHSALGNCEATLKVIEKMAADDE